MPIDQKLLSNIQFNHFKKQMLYLGEKDLKDEDIFLLVEALKCNNYIKQLNLENNYISSLGAQSLATLTTLEELDVSENNIELKGAIALSKSHLKKLNISSNPIGEGITAFASSPFLIELNAEACHYLTDKGVEQLFSSKSIKELNLSANQLSGKCLKGLISNTVLETLDFSSNNVEEKDCYFYIAQNNTLKQLTLARTFIEDEEAVFLSKSNSLENLFLRGCFIKDEGALALSKNNHLKKLSLFNNQITEAGASAFAFASNISLIYLNLEYNPFNPLNVMDLEKFYEKNDEKTYIRTEENIGTLFKKN